MATASNKTICVICDKERNSTYLCDGCSHRFCRKHLDEHQKNLDEQLEQIGNKHDQLRQNLHEQKTNPTKHPFIEQINQWEKDSIDQIKQTAQQCREKLTNYFKMLLLETEKKLNDLAQQIKEMRHENEFNEIHLDDLKERLQEIQKEFRQPPDVSIKQQSTSFINKICVFISPLRKDIRWKQLGITIAGGNGRGDRLNQLCHPLGISFDDENKTIYIADCPNHRIVEWTVNATNGQIVAGGNGKGNQNNQLNDPTDVIIDRENNSLIMTDAGNRRVMRWSRQTNSHGQIVIEDIDCSRLTMDKDGSLYVSDWQKNEVRRWKKGETNGTIVAGGNGEGNHLNQLNFPTGIFVHNDETLYVSDQHNHRVMKWVKDAKEGIVVAGGNGCGDRVTQLSCPTGLIVDQFGQIYVSDHDNHRVMRWCEGVEEGTIVVGGNGRGEQANQLDGPAGLSFDGEGNLYVVDHWNDRIQKFVID